MLVQGGCLLVPSASRGEVRRLDANVPRRFDAAKKRFFGLGGCTRRMARSHHSMGGLVLALAHVGTVAAPLTAFTGGVQICASEGGACHEGSMFEFVLVDGEHASFDHGGTSVDVRWHHSAYSADLHLEERLYSAHNAYEPGEHCSVASGGSGPCSPVAAVPLERQDGQEGYSLCCMGVHAPRGPGVHCLRWDGARPYHVYSLQSPGLQRQLSFSINGSEPLYRTNSGGAHVHVVSDENVSATVTTTVSLRSSDDSPTVMLNVGDHHRFVWDTRRSPQDWRAWFHLPHPLRADHARRLRMSAEQWRELASCATERHSETRMHTRPHGQDDQFVVMRSEQRLDTLPALQTLLWDTASISCAEPAMNETCATLRFGAHYQSSAAVVLTLLVEPAP